MTCTCTTYIPRWPKSKPFLVRYNVPKFEFTSSYLFLGISTHTESGAALLSRGRISPLSRYKLPQPEFPEMEAEQKEGVSACFIFFFFSFCPTIFKAAKSRISFPYLIWETRPPCLARDIEIGMDVFEQRKWIFPPPRYSTFSDFEGQEDPAKMLYLGKEFGLCAQLRVSALCFLFLRLFPRKQQGCSSTYDGRSI